MIRHTLPRIGPLLVESGGLEAQTPDREHFSLLESGGFFIFLFSFFTKKYIFDLEIYRNIPRPPGSRAAGAYPQKKRRQKIADRSLGAVRRQLGGRPPQAARLLGDRLSHPYIGVGWSPHPSFASLKFQKLRKIREGGREAKPCRIFEPATAGNQNSSTLYK